MYELEHVGHEFCGDGKVTGFPSLETLKLEDMKILKEWHGIGVGQFPCLSELMIINCPQMTTLPKFPSLHRLVSDECNERILNSFPYFTSLSLKISNFRKLKSLPEGLLHPLGALKELKSIIGSLLPSHDIAGCGYTRAHISPSFGNFVLCQNHVFDRSTAFNTKTLFCPSMW
uniref:Uncharacterized protein n=1 Tax=Nelumbo nucifera TaxID=4432 RepID=A0A822ZDW1_NELNU|nr:TPA_asm: hypothetical protein HUJ06_000920 [Nelumbo nucifera]